MPQSTSNFQDNVDIDVTNLIKDMRTNGNYGFMARLINENPYNIRQYHYSTATNAAKRPKLVITYN